MIGTDELVRQMERFSELSVLKILSHFNQHFSYFVSLPDVELLLLIPGYCLCMSASSSLCITKSVLPSYDYH